MIEFDEEGFAKETGEVTVFMYSENGQYIGETKELVIKGTSISANSTLIKPPKVKNSYVHLFNQELNKWEYQVTHKGEKVYQTDDQSEHEVDYYGEIKDGFTLNKPDNAYQTWNGKAWILTADAKTKQLTDAKQQKITEINTTADKVINAVSKSNEVANNELSSWTEQSQEAIAWHADNSAPCPLLRGIATTRQVPFEILAQKAYEKAIAYKNLMGGVVGLTQRYRDLVTLAKSLEELDFTVDYSIVTG